MSNCSNGSRAPTSHTLAWQNTLSDCSWVLAVLIVLANFLLLAALLTDRKLLQQRQNIFILSLAITDLCVGFIIPFDNYRSNYDLFFEEASARMSFCRYTTTLEVMVICASIYHLLALAVDRLRLVNQGSSRNISGNDESV